MSETELEKEQDPSENSETVEQISQEEIVLLEEEPPQEEETEKKPNKVVSVICTILFIFLVVLFGARIYVSSRYGGVLVQGESMRQTLQGGEWLLMELTEKGAQADYGDIIVLDVRKYPNATAEEGFLIKRLIAKGGDKVYCKEGEVYVWYQGTDGFVKLDEPYAYYLRGKSNFSFASEAHPYVVETGKIFYLGDNRQNSKDSEDEYASANGMLVNETDIHGVVYDWAIAYQTPLRLIFLTETYFNRGE